MACVRIGRFERVDVYVDPRMNNGTVVIEQTTVSARTDQPDIFNSNDTTLVEQNLQNFFKNTQCLADEITPSHLFSDLLPRL